MKWTLLGSAGSGSARLNRCGTAHLVQMGDHNVLIDCGWGTTEQLLRAGCDLAQVGPLFFSHHHSDHNIDYPHFAHASWIAGRRDPLYIWGPEGTTHFNDRLFGEDGAFRLDLVARTRSKAANLAFQRRHGHGVTWPAFTITEIDEPGEVDVAAVLGPDVRVSVAFTQHFEPHLRTLAYRIEADGKVLVVTSDTAPCRAVKDLARGADLLVHDCSATAAYVAEYDISQHHTSSLALGEVAAELGIGRLVMTHVNLEMDRQAGALDQMVAEVRQSYDGELWLGADLLTLDV